MVVTMVAGSTEEETIKVAEVVVTMIVVGRATTTEGDTTGCWW